MTPSMPSCLEDRVASSGCSNASATEVDAEDVWATLSQAGTEACTENPCRGARHRLAKIAVLNWQPSL